MKMTVKNIVEYNSQEDKITSVEIFRDNLVLLCAIL